ncbi:hypothetical protein NC652_034033 [Populus alba x Populus x berolinensis]|uniref:Uncharacterized protein n=1 Tax=Populus alba x Populus x berolinensis TaxID=444605 RepID=A0AAD6PZW1_9ROSI|nr:hypothetical protein NC652_034033 [Populus alba x Populus x berolinensis]KAJ6973761.1 hypothetical protein NC653_033941 [Populus alba x Populus x berolinensis]
MVKNKRNTRRPSLQQQPKVDLPPPSSLIPFDHHPPPTTVVGGSSLDKFLIFAEEGSAPQLIVSSPSTPDHVIVEDYSDDDDYDEDEVDYSASKGSSNFFHSPVPPSIGNNLNATLHNASKGSPLCPSRQSVVPMATSTKKGPTPEPSL